MTALTIGKLARRTGISTDTVRFYERKGLLPAPRRTASGYRVYAPDHADRLRFILRAKGLGFSLADISMLLKLNAGRGGRAAVELAQRRLVDLDRKIREMTAIREALSHLVSECSVEGVVRGNPIIESVLGEAQAPVDQDSPGAGWISAPSLESAGEANEGPVMGLLRRLGSRVLRGTPGV